MRFHMKATANGETFDMARVSAAHTTLPLPSLVETKRLMKKDLFEPVLARMAEEGASFGRMLQEPSAREAFTAFVEKRRPDFSAR